MEIAKEEKKEIGKAQDIVIVKQEIQQLTAESQVTMQLSATHTP